MDIHNTLNIRSHEHIRIVEPDLEIQSVFNQSQHKIIDVSPAIIKIELEDEQK